MEHPRNKETASTVEAVASTTNEPTIDVSALPAVMTADDVAALLQLSRKTVYAAFKKGAVLEDVGHFQVHASHRERDGQAEIHTLDTDIAYVLEGEATLVTGGVAPDAKEIGPNEFRGSRIDHGQTRRVKKGDVIVIPNGIPHMFSDLAQPFNYYVVKVRAEQ